MKFDTLLNHIRGTDAPVPGTLLSIDPGHTVGWGLFEDGVLSRAGQIAVDVSSSGTLGGDSMWELVLDIEPEVIIIENYRIYPHMSKTHTWSSLNTPKLIGYIEAICQHQGIPYYLQMASTKEFCNNDKLREWGYYRQGEPHANDAIRHGCYWLLFGKGRGK